MTVYAAASASTMLPTPTIVTKIYNVGCWVEMDRVRVERQYRTLTLTGCEGSLSPDEATIDGRPVTFAEVFNLLEWSRNSGGELERVA